MITRILSLVLLFVIAPLAGYLPDLRASRVDPMTGLPTDGFGQRLRE